MSTSWIVRLEDLDRTQVGSAGGKGASLGELVRAGVRVPPGFVLTRPAFDAFLEAADPSSRVSAWLAEVDAGQLGIGDAASKVAELLGDAPISDEIRVSVKDAAEALGARYVSVRSSATCEDGSASAWAGQLDTFLNVGPDELLDQIRACWLSIFRAPALAYGATHGYGAGEFGVAVVVQEMVASEVAGIGFSVHPVTQEPDLRLIEACFGQGEAIVSGEVDPDQYVVERGARSIMQRRQSRQKKGLFLAEGQSEPVWRDLGAKGGAPKLDDDQVLEYAGLLDTIESHYGHPVDTEWALADGRFHLLQARPITTLAPEYQESIIDPSVPWNGFIRRPLSLFEVSVINHWLDTKHAGDDLGLHMDRQLAIQDTHEVVTLLVDQDAQEAAFAHFQDLERNDRARYISLLQEAHRVYEDGARRVDSGEGFEDLDAAAEYFSKIGKFTTAFPAWTLMALDAGHIEDTEIRELAEGLRARSLYTPVAHGMLDPILHRFARELGFSEPTMAERLVTWQELQRGEVDLPLLEQRLSDVKAGKKFVLQVRGEDEMLRFVSETGYLLMRISGQREVVPPDDPDRLSGQAAWPGFHRGRARVILSSDPAGYSVEDGDVIISIQSNPALMPLLRHAGAIVTDEGGVACHASIICRELKIPTLIGTGAATSKIRDGDIVEVDATEQVIRVVERAPSSP
ncbi:MAG: PEP/pyruvate-binding domain-containing protein [Myxococcota bacterium]